MQPDTIFATGFASDNDEGINMCNSGRMLRWVAVRGGMWDWTIYCHWDDRSESFIKDYGEKVHYSDTIRRLVDCDDEAFKMYRY